MIKVKPGQRTIRETTCDFEYTDETGELKKATIRVQYYSPTTKQSKEEQDALRRLREEDPNAIWWVTNTLANRLHALPDLVDDNGEPIPITVDFLDSLDFKNVEAINQAIVDDLLPKSLGRKSPSG
ncbi:MAG: hypothetical protein C4287_23180 [Leptolyngbya sp. ERB_1_2]